MFTMDRIGRSGSPEYAIVQGTLGGWWRFLHGGYGTMQVGAQYSYTRRSTFSGVGGSPGADNNTVLVSFRYLPFQ